LDGGTIKGYIDAIQRKCWAVERTSRKLSSLYGKWSWKANNEYDIISKTLAHKVDAEDKKYRGKKEKKSMTSDSITLKSWKLLIDRTFQKRDSYQNNNDLANYIKTNASLCVHIHTLFCGCRAQEEISHLIVQDFKDHSPNCIEFKLSGDFKTRKLGANFNFLDRESSFIFSQKYCDPFRIFMYYRPPSAIDRFFLYHQPSARFGNGILLSQSKPIGPKPLAQAVKVEITSLVSDGLIPSGIYSNTSLRKALSDTLSLAHVPPVIVDLAVGHFNSKSGQTSSAFTSTPNLPSYLSLWKQSITRKKIALLLFDPTTTWKDIWDEDHFHSFYKRLFPGDYNSAVASTSQNNEEATFLTVSPMAGKNTPAPPFNFTDSDLMCFDNEPLSPHGDQPTIPLAMSRFDEDSYPDELFLSLLTPPDVHRTQQPVSNQNFAQQNIAVNYATTIAPVIHIHGGTVNFHFGAGPGI